MEVETPTRVFAVVRKRPRPCEGGGINLSEPHAASSIPASCDQCGRPWDQRGPRCGQRGSPWELGVSTRLEALFNPCRIQN